LKDVISDTKIGPDSAVTGKLYNVKGVAVYPVISTVTDKKQIVGYFIAWKSVLTTAKAVDQFAQFVGPGSSFYIGNEDGSLWTNFIKPLDSPPFKVGHLPASIQFTDPDEGSMIGEVRLIANTKLSTAVTVSERTVLKGVASFVNWIIVIGVVLLAIGIITAWLMSRRITKPLNQLIAAATAISQGNYSTPVPISVYQTDELGKLASAFNIMLEQVFRMHNDLEDKVEERTSQLENVNKELEAFSYSVSHDLRTPLRAINGYSIMLKEDYAAELDSEGNRILRNIITNAKMMGQLIDDLLAFSRLGKKELVRSHVDMQSLAENVVDELLQHEPENKYRIGIDLLPGIEADQVMIRQVLINLVSNAIKYTSKKAQPEIVIGSKEEEKRIIYHIKDNGAGFDMAYSAKLYGVFQRLHSQEEFEGTGVGLALVKRIIDKHKGDVWAEGIENIGATFYFSLPKL
jgi:signal transduction histidine kinase